MYEKKKKKRNTHEPTSYFFQPSFQPVLALYKEKLVFIVRTRGENTDRLVRENVSTTLGIEKFCGKNIVYV